MSIETATGGNPLLESWDKQPFLLPPFTAISPSHFPPAFEEGMAAHLSDLQAIVDDPAAPTFENTIAAYDRTGRLLSKVRHVFSNFCSSLNTDDLKEIQKELVPVLSRHSSAAYTLPGLFDKIEAVHERRHEAAAGLDPEQIRLIERLHLDFTREGAHFGPEKKKEYADIKAQLASLCTEFGQNVMKDEETSEIVLAEDDLSGCPASLVAAAQEAAQERGKGAGEYVITLSRSLVEPFLTYASRRDLREKVWDMWSRRGELADDRANLPIALELLKLRKKQAEMHGFKSFAEYQCADMMAKTPGTYVPTPEPSCGPRAPGRGIRGLPLRRQPEERRTSFSSRLGPTFSTALFSFLLAFWFFFISLVPPPLLLSHRRAATHRTPGNVMKLLENVWERAKKTANREREALEEYCKSIGDDLGEKGIEPWDWR